MVLVSVIDEPLVLSLRLARTLLTSVMPAPLHPLVYASVVKAAALQHRTLAA